MRKLLLSLILSTFFIVSLYADEGMWMLNLLKHQKLAHMQERGLKLQDYDIYKPDGSSLKDAVVQFGSGCTGEVISPHGLILTNHHCGYRQIQSHSSIENNYLDNGFWAMAKEEELPNPGLTVTFIENIEDVTEYVKHCLERDKEMDSLGVFFLSPKYLNGIAREKTGEEYLKDNIGTDVEIKPFFNGNQYYMFTKKIYSDVRLVGAPPSSIGKFGADTDNWTWPRHSGDFSLFRIYTDKDGNPAKYSVDNIPLKPKKWLTISTKGVEEGDFAMMLGFPGSTNKYYTSWEVAERRDIDNNVRIKMRELRQEAMLEEMLKDPQVKIQYASKYSGSTNGYKNAIGTNWAINLNDFEQLKMDQQNRLLDWAQENNEPKYQEALNEIKQMVNDRANIRYRSRMLNEGIARAVEFASIPTSTVDRLIDAFNIDNKEDIEILTGKLIEEYYLFADKDYNRDVDMKVSKEMIKEYTNLIHRENLPEYFDIIYTDFDGDSDKFVNYIFENSLFGNEEKIQELITGITDVDKLINDPMFQFAKSVRKETVSLNRQLSQFDNPFANAVKTYLEGILEMDGPYTHFPDANLTLRLTYGEVKGYKPVDAVYYNHQTTIEGIFEKEDPDNWEFVVPDKLRDIHKEKEFGQYTTSNGSIPVNFVATTHTTGGNSGSPVMNANGELTGINFDRNWEGVGGDIQYLPDYQRSIIVDIRYVLFVIDKFANATHLIEELEIN